MAPGERTSELNSYPRFSDWLYTFNVRPEVVQVRGYTMGTGVFGWDVGRESSEGTTHKPEDRLHSGYDSCGRNGMWRGRRQQEGPRTHVALACVLGVITP